VFHYCEGYCHKDRERLEKAFALEIANMMGYINGQDGKLKIFIMPMKDAIDEWVAPDYTPFEFGEGKMLAVDIFNEVGATVLYDFGGKYLESYQLAKIDGTWRIVNKFIVNP
jgi:hypothetical protein